MIQHKHILLLASMVILLFIPYAQAVIDSSICDTPNTNGWANPWADVLTSCLKTCELGGQGTSALLAMKQKELDAFYDTESNCPMYRLCLMDCYDKILMERGVPLGTAPAASGLDMDKILIDDQNSMMQCVEQDCHTEYGSCMIKLASLQIEVDRLKFILEDCKCAGCYLPYYVYANDGGYAKRTVDECDAKRIAAYGAPYPAEMTTHVGCSGITTTPGNNQQNQTTPQQNQTTNQQQTQTNTTQQNQTTFQKPAQAAKATPLTAKQQQQKQETEQKIQQIKVKPGMQTIEMNTKEGKKEIVLNNPDNSKLDPGYGWYMKKEMLEKAFDDFALGKFKKLSYWTDYIKKYVDNDLSDDEQTKQTQAELNVGKNAAELFNNLEGIKEEELRLNPVKSSIPILYITEPSDFIFSQMEAGVKKTMAYSYHVEYMTALEQAREIRAAGASWSDTIGQTTKLMAEEDGVSGKQMALNRYSKYEYKTQAARINMYILQMKENGELQ